MNRFEDLPKDVIFYLALKLDLPEILSLCRTSKKFNISVCNNKYFWIARLRQDYNIEYMTIKPVDPKTYYKFYKNYGYFPYGIQLEQAAREGSLDIVKLMIDNGADNWNYGLRGAAFEGNIDIVKLMIKKGATGWNGGLREAAFGGHKDIVELMINNGADNWNGGLKSAVRGGHKDIVQMMIDNGANAWDEGLYWAKFGGHRDIGELMIKYGGV